MRQFIKSTELKSISIWMISTSILSVVALFCYTLIPNKVLELVPINPEGNILFYDGLSNGTTTGKWIDKSSNSFECIVTKGIQWNYCGYQFDVADFFMPVDLSQYNILKTKINYSGTQLNKAVRLTFRSVEPSISKPNIISSFKHMNVELEKNELKHEVVLTKQEWSISRYWVDKNTVPRSKHNLDFSRIIQLSVDLTQPIELGHHMISVEYLTLEGAWILKETWYLVIIILWMGINFFIISHRVVKLDYRVHKDIEQITALSGYTNILKNQSEKYKALSATDSLTGALNRYGLNNFVTDLFPNKILTGEVSILILDLDHFKSINDSYGHNIGDVVLKKISKVIISIIRSSDGFCRWGGEEFIMFCPNTDESEATKIAHKIRKSISDLIFYTDNRVDFNVTVSIGVAQAYLNEHFDELFKRVDKALYVAKHSGRNRVDQAESEEVY
ncbi:GGDEF domain-containing protein [Marinicellulosiphila megalodicopiae]|uniref:GGDEF domain-containing protein n=1 Tax=Marinicellulosiphila megalodicopiae TaxID=2724896 RepID=UPI003BB0A0F3